MIFKDFYGDDDDDDDNDSDGEIFIDALDNYFEERHSEENSNTLLTNVDYGDHEEKEENIELPEAVLCKICLNKQLNCMFSPCGHVYTCLQCGVKCKFCPICRTSTGKKKIFISI